MSPKDPTALIDEAHPNTPARVSLETEGVPHHVNIESVQDTERSHFRTERTKTNGQHIRAQLFGNWAYPRQSDVLEYLEQGLGSRMLGSSERLFSSLNGGSFTVGLSNPDCQEIWSGRSIFEAAKRVHGLLKLENRDGTGGTTVTVSWNPRTSPFTREPPRPRLTLRLVPMEGAGLTFLHKRVKNFESWKTIKERFESEHGTPRTTMSSGGSEKVLSTSQGNDSAKTEGASQPCSSEGTTKESKG